MTGRQKSEGGFSSPGWLFRRETLAKNRADRSLVDIQLGNCGNQVFRKNLFAHFGCINAIEFSEDGQLLVSGGDDRRVLLWNVGNAICKQESPKAMQAEHSSNIFALAFDCTRSKIYSAGNDDQVILHDMHTGVPLDYFKHEQPVFGVCGDPVSGSIFSSAGDDGKILIYDTREPNGEPFLLASSLSSYHAVMFHPTESRLILTANAKEGAALWDVRRPKLCLLKYSMDAGSCCMSARFNQNGTQVLALRRRLPPILYSTSSKRHLFEFHHISYYNSCTMKSCSFAGTNDQFVMSGSDNFDLHIWKIPPEGRDVDSWVSEATAVLKGHRSIVNQVRYNPSFNVIASSGVEKMVKLWSPFNIPDTRRWKDGNTGLLSEPERKIYAHEEYIRMTLRSGHGPFMSLQQDAARRNMSEDSRMMAFFDALVQRDIAGLSDEESAGSSTYTNTVYSSAESSTSNSDLEPPPQVRRRDSDNSSISIHSSEDLVETLNQPEPAPIENDNQQSATEAEEVVDSPDSESEPEATVEFNDLPVFDDGVPDQSDDADDEDDIDDEPPALESPSQFERRQFGNLPRLLIQYDDEPQIEIRWGLRSDSEDSDRERTRSPPVSLGTHDPNRLTVLISENTSKLCRRGPNKQHRRKRPLPREESGSDDMEAMDQNVTSLSSSSDNDNNRSLRARIRQKKRRRITSNTPSTPVYESSTSNVTGSTTSNCPSTSYQLVSDLMTRGDSEQLHGEESELSEAIVTRGSSETDTSSFSSSTSHASSLSTDQIGDSNKGKSSSSGEDSRRQKGVIRNGDSHKLSDSSSDSDNSIRKPELTRKKSSQIRRRVKAEKDSVTSTPSDSGVDMNNSTGGNTDKPCCSKSLGEKSLTKTEVDKSHQNPDTEKSSESGSDEKTIPHRKK